MTNWIATERYYTIFGLGMSIHAETSSISNALDSRLRYFRSELPTNTDITVTVRLANDATNHFVKRPAGVSRQVYDPPAGETLYFDDSHQMYLDNGRHVRVRSDVADGAIRISIASEDSASCWAASHGLFTLPLIDVLKRHGRYSLHAACLSIDGKGMLLAGTSGSGKSTLALALLPAGFDFLGDDMVFLSTEPDGIQALAFPDEIDVTTDTIRFFPELAHLAGIPLAPGWPKYQVRIEELYGVEPTAQCRPAVLLFPRVSGNERSVVTSLDPYEALTELAPNILLTDGPSSQAHFDVLAGLVQQCACYRLETGTDLQAARFLLRNLLQ